ncbi:hypothetical protein EW146_g2014 [Bondarzewia mesenterica]|uniref:Uncharacterized protein n=1 Tax=Bondarzewia mesenterica TaxID=1095465 RepID=A0A4S4M1Z8_9AGAM|nr:hypothetical protein EW146_g2014 [Bondarzewia mesenterica]
MSIDLSLDRIRALLANVRYTRPTIHIAGTNGKGSVSSLVSSILLAASLSVGRFNSPHLISVLDSIALNGQPISAATYASARETVETLNTVHQIGASNFELLTCTALLVFERAEVDLVVLEVGMGGRLDATNVIPDECVLVSALTAVDFDHQAFLGTTVGEIAREKASIARRGRAFVLGPQKYAEVGQVVRQLVEDIGGDLIVATPARKWEQATSVLLPEQDRGFRRPPPQSVEVSLSCFEKPILAKLPLYGDHQLDNLGTASKIVDALITHPYCAYRLYLRSRIIPDVLSSGIEKTVWPGRLSFHDVPLHILSRVGSQKSGSQDLSNQGMTVLADGAHNPSSSSTLAAYISHLLGGLIGTRTIHLTYILALSHSPPKMPIQTLSPLFSLPLPPNTQVRFSVAVLGFTPVEGMPWVQPVPPFDLARVVHDLAPGADIWQPKNDQESIESQLRQALKWAGEKQSGGGDPSLVVLAGSLYLVADFYRLLQDADE